MKKLIAFSLALFLFACANKQKQIAKKWMVQQTEVAGQKLDGELVEGFYMEIKEDGTYKVMGMGEESGKWVLKGDSLVTTNDENRTVAYFIQSLDDKDLSLYDNSVGTGTVTVFKAE